MAQQRMGYAGWASWGFFCSALINAGMDQLESCSTKNFIIEHTVHHDQ